jgi:arylsulfate sulfotransferase
VQPDDPKEKYSRAVVYKIDQKKMTVEQIWEYGKNRGHELYAPITSSVEYQKDKDSVVVYWASIGLGSKEGPADRIQVGRFEALDRTEVPQYARLPRSAD